MDRRRRSFLQRAAVLGAGLFSARTVAAGQQDQHAGHGQMPMPPGMQMGEGSAPPAVVIFMATRST